MGSRNALPEDFRQVIHMLEEHRFPVDDAVSSIVPIEEAQTFCARGATILCALKRSWSAWIETMRD